MTDITAKVTPQPSNYMKAIYGQLSLPRTYWQWWVLPAIPFNVAINVLTKYGVNGIVLSAMLMVALCVFFIYPVGLGVFKSAWKRIKGQGFWKAFWSWLAMLVVAINWVAFPLLLLVYISVIYQYGSYY